MAKENTKQNIPVSAEKAEGKTGLSRLHPVTDIERLFERFFSRNWPSFSHWPGTSMMGGLPDEADMRVPNLDIIDRDNEIVVRAEVPGIDKKDLNISLTDNLLTVKGQTSKEKKEEKGDYYRREIARSSFARSVTLPGSVDSARAAASLKDGVLEITLPKLEASRRRNISVS